MSNLLELVVSLAENAQLRDRYCADPGAAVDDDVTGEDVIAAARLARVQVSPADSERLDRVGRLRPRPGESPNAMALRALSVICDCESEG